MHGRDRAIIKSHHVAPIMNKLRVITSTAVFLATIGVFAMVAMAFYPMATGGLDVDTIGYNKDTKIIIEDDLDLSVTMGKIVIGSNMPYDFTRVAVSVYMDVNDKVNIPIYDLGSTVLKKGEKLIIDLDLLIPPDRLMEMSAWMLSENATSTTGFNVPITLHVQGYYLNDMIGASADVKMDANISSTSKIVITESTPNKISGTLSELSTGLLNSIPASGSCSISGADGVSVVDLKLSKDGGIVSISAESVSGNDIVKDLNSCAAGNNGALKLKLNVDGHDPREIDLNSDQTKAFIEVIGTSIEELKKVAA